MGFGVGLLGRALADVLADLAGLIDALHEQAALTRLVVVWVAGVASLGGCHACARGKAGADQATTTGLAKEEIAL